MAKEKTLRDRLFGAAVLKTSFVLRGAEGSPAFNTIYPGVLRDLNVTAEQVDAFVGEHRDEVEKAARGSTGGDDDDE